MRFRFWSEHHNDKTFCGYRRCGLNSDKEIMLKTTAGDVTVELEEKTTFKRVPPDNRNWMPQPMQP